jgi:hypothetical protein
MPGQDRSADFSRGHRWHPFRSCWRAWSVVGCRWWRLRSSLYSIRFDGGEAHRLVGHNARSEGIPRQGRGINPIRAWPLRGGKRGAAPARISDHSASHAPQDQSIASPCAGASARFCRGPLCPGGMIGLVVLGPKRLATELLSSASVIGGSKPIGANSSEVMTGRTGPIGPSSPQSSRRSERRARESPPTGACRTPPTASLRH